MYESYNKTDSKINFLKLKKNLKVRQALGTSKVSSCQDVKLSGCQVVKFDPWDMLNNFSFHVYAQKSLSIGENVNALFGHKHHPPL